MSTAYCRGPTVAYVCRRAVSRGATERDGRGALDSVLNVDFVEFFDIVRTLTRNLSVRSRGVAAGRSKSLELRSKLQEVAT